MENIKERLKNMEVRLRKIERKKKGNEGKPKFLEIRIENF